MTPVMRSEEWDSIGARQEWLGETTLKKRRDRVFRSFAKHYGPGPHPGTGTEQDEHGKGGLTHGSSRVHVPAGSGDQGGEKVVKLLVDAEGYEFPNSFEALGGDIYVSVNGVISASPRNDIQATILAAVEGAGLDAADIDNNLTLIMESAMARYAADPAMIDADRFYEGWHVALHEISEATGVEFSRVVTAAAVISPNLKASANLHFAQDLATWVAEDVTWSGEARAEILAYLEKSRDAILFPVYMDRHEEVVSGKVKLGDPRPPPEEGSHRWRQGQDLAETIERIKDKESFAVSDLSSFSAAYALHRHRQLVGGLNLSEDIHPMFRGKKPKGGFSALNFAYYRDAIAVLRGEVSPSDTLGDVKTRSFHNNILDPFDSLGYQDVTVDFHALDSAFMARGFQTSNLVSSPAVEGVGVGLRPLVADAVRRLAAKYKVGDEVLTSGRAQEILWAEWARGKTEIRKLPEGTVLPKWAESAGPRTVTHYRTFDGTLIPLYSLG